MNEAAPWLFVFVFGTGVFIIGLILQRKERQQRRDRSSH